MVRKFFIAIMLIALCSIVVEAKVNRRVKYSCTPLKCLVIDSIEYKANVTRVYGKIIGRPHTSMRFDNISGCSDIEGVDLKRWFQFEDSGKIPVELDFKKMRYKTPFSFKITSAAGIIAKNPITCTIK